MHIETEDLTQAATLWESVGIDETARPIVKQPIQIPTRWEERRTEGIDVDSSPIAIDANIVVDRHIPVGSIIRKGRLDSLPENLDELYKVVHNSEVPDIKDIFVRRRVSVIKFGDDLPTVV